MADQYEQQSLFGETPPQPPSGGAAPGQLPFVSRDQQLRGAQGGSSPRTQKRTQARTFARFSHPSNPTTQVEGQLFDKDPFQRAQEAPKAPGWGVPHGRPSFPGQGGQQPGAEQLKLTKATQPETPSPFAQKGLGRYVVKNGNGLQFNKPAVRSAVQKGVQSYGEAQYFRHAGFGAALRHTLGMPQMPSHMNDYLRARHNTSVRGVDPHSITAQLAQSDPSDYFHWGD